MRGGYKIINLNNVNLTLGGDAVKVDGIYEALEGNYNKPTVLSGITIGGLEYTDMYLNFTVNEAMYIGILFIPKLSTNPLQIEITSEDMVKISETNY